jgi:hypothetical protein
MVRPAVRPVLHQVANMRTRDPDKRWRDSDRRQAVCSAFLVDIFGKAAGGGGIVCGGTIGGRLRQLAHDCQCQFEYHDRPRLIDGIHAAEILNASLPSARAPPAADGHPQHQFDIARHPISTSVPDVGDLCHFFARLSGSVICCPTPCQHAGVRGSRAPPLIEWLAAFRFAASPRC